MYALELTTVFSAAHAIVIAGRREALHGHDWHVTVCLEGPAVDADGLLLDFHEAERHLREIVAPFHNANLNRTPPFDRVNPTAEAVARHIAESLRGRLESRAPKRPKTRGSARSPVRVASVRITEAVGCAAVYRPPARRTGSRRR
ncbi:MAG: 6-carboxytetrahydropterin synthase [Phycisphaerae bacterium]|nr:6-carboxytetrahydropterin synthase [Phycisphaerae bacterium]